MSLFLLVNISSLSNIILNCLKCISDYLWQCSVSGEDAKSTNRDACIVATSIGNIESIWVGLRIIFF